MKLNPFRPLTSMTPLSSMTLRTLLTLLTFLGVSACSKNPPSSSPNPSTDTIRVGEVSTLTGNEASFGNSTHRGIELAIREINAKGGIHGKQLELFTLDDQGKPEEASSNATQLITRKHVVAIFAGLPSSRIMAIAPIAQENKTLIVSSSGTHPKITEFGNFIFRVCFIDPFQGRVMAKFALENLKLTRVAVLRDVKSDYSLGLADYFVRTFKAAGGKIIVEQSYSAGDIDFKSQLTAVRSKSPQAIFIPGYYTEAALIARQARELGMNIPLLGGDGFDSPKFLEIGGAALNGTYFSTHYSSDSQEPRVRNFISEFKKAYGMVPDGLTTLGYDAVMVFAEAAKKAATPTAVDIRKELAVTKDVPGVTGAITLDQNRNPVKAAVILKIENGGVHYHSTINP